MKLVVCLVVVFSAALSAQAPVVDPVKAEWTPSPNHALVLQDGTPVLTDYELIATALKPLGATSPITMAAGKPNINAAGTVASEIWEIRAQQTPGKNYVIRVAANGPGGTDLSEPSNPFCRSGGPEECGIQPGGRRGLRQILLTIFTFRWLR